MTNPTGIQPIADFFDNPLIHTLIQLVPGIGGATDALLTMQIESMRTERLWMFFEELAKGTHELTKSLIHEEDFLHAYFSTLRAVINTRRKEKIKLFARLLLSATRENYLGDDTFEEFLNILDDLSVRELQILVILKRFEDSHPHILAENGEMENDMQRARRYWSSFVKEVENICGLGSDELKMALNRLRRTGFYEPLTGYLDMSGDIGVLSPVFTQFAFWIRANAEDFSGRSFADKMSTGLT